MLDGKKRFLAIGLLVGYVIGYFLARSIFYYPNLWHSEETLQKLNAMLKNDKSQRLAIVIMTEDRGYGFSALWREKFQPFYGIMNVKGEIVQSNLDDLKNNFVQKDPIKAQKIMDM